MSGLPKGWEWDYDGSRWFYRYKPTGIIQYTFPKPGDEFPQFIDTSSGTFDLAPEDWLASEQQVKQRSAQDGAQSTAKATGSQRRKKAVEDNDEMSATGYFDPESFMYLGPGAYTDISPDVDAQDSVRPKGQEEENVRPQISSVGVQPGVVSLSSHLDVLQTTDSVIVEEPITAAQNSQASDSPVPILHHQAEPAELSAQQPWSPVGLLSELASQDTVRCAEEMRPIELDSTLAGTTPETTSDKNAPIELPADDLYKPNKGLKSTSLTESATYTLAPLQSVGSYPLVSASFAYSPLKNDASASGVDRPAAPQDPKFNEHGLPVQQADEYRPWTPGQRSPQRQISGAKRESEVLSNISILQSQNADLGPMENKRHSLSGPPPSLGHDVVMRHPTVLTPSMSSKARLDQLREGRDSSQGSSKPILQLVATRVNAVESSDNAKQLPSTQSANVPGTRARHESISANTAAVVEPDLNHFPSVLRPASWRRHAFQGVEEPDQHSEQLQISHSIASSRIPDDTSLPNDTTFDYSHDASTRPAINLDQDVHVQQSTTSTLPQPPAGPPGHDRSPTTATQVMASEELSSPQSPHPPSRSGPGFMVFHEVPPTPTRNPAPASLPSGTLPGFTTAAPAHHSPHLRMEPVFHDELSTATSHALESTQDISESTRPERLHFTDTAPFAIVIQPRCSEQGQTAQGTSYGSSKQQSRAIAPKTADEQIYEHQTPICQPEESTNVVIDELISDLADLNASGSTTRNQSDEGWAPSSTADVLSCSPPATSTLSRLELHAIAPADTRMPQSSRTSVDERLISTTHAVPSDAGFMHPPKAFNIHPKPGIPPLNHPTTDVTPSQASNSSVDGLQSLLPPEQRASSISQTLPTSTSQESSPANSFVSPQHTPTVSSVSIQVPSHMSHGSIQGSPIQSQPMVAQMRPQEYPPFSAVNAGPTGPHNWPVQQPIHHQQTWSPQHAPTYTQQATYAPQPTLPQQQTTSLPVIQINQTQSQFQTQGYSSVAMSSVGKGMKKWAKKAWKNPAVKQVTAAITGAVVADSLGANPAAGASLASKIYASSQSAKPGTAAGRPPGPIHAQTAPPQAQNLGQSSAYVTAHAFQPPRPASVQAPGRPAIIQNTPLGGGHSLYMHHQPHGAGTFPNPQWTTQGQADATLSADVSLNLDIAQTQPCATTSTYDNGTVMVMQPNYGDMQQYTMAPPSGGSTVVMTDTTFTDTIAVDDYEANTVVDLDANETVVTEDTVSSYNMGDVVTTENDWGYIDGRLLRWGLG